ncbi:MAG: ATP-dependent helicase [Dehalococcoidia bacterium]|nr:ATP-dependent helicase [Dehalococcoidia bacterium]
MSQTTAPARHQTARPDPTPEQEAVLNSEARVRVIKASPGSGKTWLVAEVVRRELATWKDNSKGIAALSFTRVAGQEIRKAVGYDLLHPHFVGTLDAFLLRFVILPFLSKVYPTLKRPRLIPADWRPAFWTKQPDGNVWEHRVASGGAGKSYNLFNVCYVDEVDGKPVMKYRGPHRGRLDEIDQGDLEGLRSAKKRVWQKLGWLSHSDAALLSSYVLSSRRYGKSICGEIARRFPLLIVDELQDTGYYLGKSVLALAGHSDVRSVLVGDPDQAIFEFGGARPDMFGRFAGIPGAVTFPLAQSRRCPPSVATAASNLKDSGGQFEPAPDSRGRAFLVEYGDMTADVHSIARAVQAARPDATIKVIARANATVEELARSKAAMNAVRLKLGCTELNHVQRAVILFRQGRQSSALASVRASIDRAVFGHEGASDEELVDKGIDPGAWKALACNILVNCNSIEVSGTVYDWQVEAGLTVRRELEAFGQSHSLAFKTEKLRPQRRRPSCDFPVSQCVPGPDGQTDLPQGISFQSVHAVKGETHDATILVCPEPARNRKCPSEIWWSASDTDREEKRIAYVAMTRTRGDLVVCVAKRTLENLSEAQPSFVTSFQVFDAGSFPAAYQVEAEHRLAAS